MVYKLKLHFRYGDTDQMGVIYHANYLSFYELGRTGLLKEAGYDYLDFEKAGIIYPVRDVSTTYLKSIRLDETCYVYTTLIKVSKVKLTFYHEIKNEQGELKSTGETSVVSVDAKTFLPIRLSDEITEKFRKYKDED
jgi:acyl-CoA thioester hydrolase